MRLSRMLALVVLTAAPAVATADSDPPDPLAPHVQGTYGHGVEYGQLGTFELGASAGLTLASNLRDVNLSPSLGYFVGDTFEISGILGVTNIAAGNESSTVMSALVEPSFHFAMNKDVFVFLGMGAGAAYVRQLGTAVAVAPRAGFNVRVGASGVLTPSLSYLYTMHDAMATRLPDGTTDVTLLAVSSTLRANIGYSVMW